MTADARGEGADEGRERELVVHTTSPVPPALAFGVAMTLGAFALFLRIPTHVFHLTRIFDFVRIVGFGLVVLAGIPRRVHIGPEAIRVRWLFGARLIRYEDVKRAAPLAGDVVIVLRDGRGLRLHPPIGSKKRIASVALERIWQTIAAGAESGTRGAERALLARDGRGAREWVTALRALVPQGAQYRRGIDHGRLWAIVENPAVETEVRAAAAIALSTTFDDGARDRLRAIVRETIDPRLQEALSRIADATGERELEGAVRPIMTTPPA